MDKVLWSIFVTVTSVLLMIQCVLGSSSISSFIVKSWNITTRSWVVNASIFPREDVRLECTPTEFSQVNELHITRADRFPLSIDHTMDIQKDSQSLVVILKSVECSQMGTYVCQNGRGDKRTVDLGIYKCLQPCKDQSTNITLYVSVNKTKQFSVCIQAFPSISSRFFFKGIEVRFNRTDKNSSLHCSQNKTEDVFSTYNISCTTKVGGEINYGVHNFSIPSGTTQNQTVSFAVEKPGPPDCPTNITSTNQGKGIVKLSWQPANNRGGSQPINYTIFYITNETDWQMHNIVEDTQTTISNLKTDTVYELRVVSANENSKVIDKNTCNNTVKVRTAADITTTITTTTTTTTTPTATTTTTTATTTSSSKDLIVKTGDKPTDYAKQDVKEVLTPIVIIVIVLASIVVIAVVVGLVVCLKIRKVYTGIKRTASLATLSYHASQRSLATPRGEELRVRFMEDGDRGAASPRQGTGRYVSREGLTYVTIDHSNSRPNSERRKNDKVTYSTLDPINTGKYTVSEIPSDKEYENILYTL